MTVHRVRRGLQLPIAGEPRQAIEQGAAVSHVAVLADDSIGLRPAMEVAEGDDVLRGQLLFDDKRTPGVRYTAPGGGRVAAINRGAKRALQSVVIELSADERAGAAEQVSFASYTGSHPSTMGGDDVRALLLESGLWTSLRARPFSRVANPATRPRSVFVTAMDTDPLAPDVEVILRGREAEFERGLAAAGEAHRRPRVRLHVGDVLAARSRDRAPAARALRGAAPGRHGGVAHSHAGPGRPRAPRVARRVSGRAGDRPPVRDRRRWTCAASCPWAARGVASAPARDAARRLHRRPRRRRAPARCRARHLGVHAVRTDGDGTRAGFLGRYHRQITALPELGARAFMGWARPGLAQFSATRAFAVGAAARAGASR
jgi:Na+-transporting NADH:ubiquinone oxidoreductase subunit A